MIAGGQRLVSSDHFKFQFADRLELWLSFCVFFGTSAKFTSQLECEDSDWTARKSTYSFNEHCCHTESALDTTTTPWHIDA